VAIDSLEPPVATSDTRSKRHSDGTYRFLSVKPGPRQITVTATDGSGFTWSAATAILVPAASPATPLPLVIEMWPTPAATVSAGTIAVRGRLVTAVAGQEVRMEVVGAPARNRRTRCDARGEFVFVVVGMMALTADFKVELVVTVPGRVLNSIQIIDGATNPVTVGTHFSVVPGRETRARFNLT
jgi:hypothetical protein